MHVSDYLYTALLRTLIDIHHIVRWPEAETAEEAEEAGASDNRDEGTHDPVLQPSI